MYLNPFEETQNGQSQGRSGGGGAEPSHRFSVARLWSLVYRSRFSIGAFVAAGLAIAIAYTLLVRPVYEAIATVEVKREAQKVLGTEDQRDTDAVGDSDRFLQTQINIVRSRLLASAVVDDLGLDADDAFLTSAGIKLSSENGEITEARRQSAIIDALLDKVDVRLSSQTRILVISFRSPDAGIAARVSNSFAENYVKLNLKRKSDASKYSLDFLRGQLKEAQARLGQSEQRVVDYARATRIIDPGAAPPQKGDTAAPPQSLTTATLVMLNSDAATATSKRIAAQEKWSQVSKAPLLSITEVLSNPAVQYLQQQRAEQQALYEEQLGRRKADYPTVKQSAARIAELDNQISSLAKDIRKSIQQEFLVALSQERSLQGKLNGLKDNTLNEQNQGIQLSILRREAQTNREQFDALLNRFNQLNAESGVQLNNLSIVDEAEVPVRPVWPKLPLNIALGLLLGLTSAAGFVLIREQIFDLVRSPDDVTDRLHLQLLGAIPPAQDVSQEMEDTKSPISEAFNAVRTSLMFASPQGLPKTILVTSTQQSEGKSTSCYAMAVSLAKLGKQIVVIDADLRRPNVHNFLGVPNRIGVTEILIGGATIDSALIHRDAEKVDFLTTGAIPINPTDLLASASFAELIEALGKRYDHVLIDCAPVLGLADAPIVAGVAEATIFVIESGRTRIRGAATALGRLRATGGHVVGAVLSRFDPQTSGYGYEYNYAYRYQYGS
jgi:capsular exopolysaccharide synthesis family protein